MKDRMKNVLIYKTTSNFTKRYAEWVSEELKSDVKVRNVGLKMISCEII